MQGLLGIQALGSPLPVPVYPTVAMYAIPVVGSTAPVPTKLEGLLARTRYKLFPVNKLE